MPRHYINIRAALAKESQQKRQDERKARVISSEFDEKCKSMEARMQEIDEKSAGLVVTLEDVIASNKNMVDSVLTLMDAVKLKEGPNTTKRKLARLEGKTSGKSNRGR